MTLIRKNSLNFFRQKENNSNISDKD